MSGTKKRSAYEKRENYRVRLNKLATVPYHDSICSLFYVQIVEELLATAPSQASQTSETQTCESDDACASGVSVTEQENVIQSGLESVTICSGQTKRTCPCSSSSSN